jgi:hypothetical protein
MSQILFFALREDLLPVLELVEGKEPVKYVLTGNFPERKVARGVPTFDRGAAIPNLGKADHENGSETYFVHERDARLRFRRLRGVGGNRVIVGDQSREPDTVSFTPGGLWKRNIVLRGTISTISDSPVSRRLMRRFQAAMKKCFSRVYFYYVGPKALELLKSGARLTAAEQCPRERDLVLPDSAGIDKPPAVTETRSAGCPDQGN